MQFMGMPIFWATPNNLLKKGLLKRGFFIFKM